MMPGIRAAAIAIVLGAAWPQGCESTPASSSPSPSTKADADAAGSDAADGAPGSNPDALACDLAKSIVGLTYWVNQLVVTEPKNDFILEALNPLWKQDIANDKLIVLFHITAHDPKTGKGQAEVGSGKLEAGTYFWYDKPTVVDLTTQGCQFVSTSSSPFELNSSTVNKPVIITNFSVEGSLLADATAVAAAHMKGTIRKTDAEGLEIVMDNGVKLVLIDLFAAAEVARDADTDGDGTKDAWTLAGDLTATAVTNVDLK